MVSSAEASEMEQDINTPPPPTPVSIYLDLKENPTATELEIYQSKPETAPKKT